jgi:MOSC domain-containing protein YiiM
MPGGTAGGYAAVLVEGVVRQGDPIWRVGVEGRS